MSGMTKPSASTEGELGSSIVFDPVLHSRTGCSGGPLVGAIFRASELAPQPATPQHSAPPTLRETNGSHFMDSVGL
jgi:hypothetical protein